VCHHAAKSRFARCYLGVCCGNEIAICDLMPQIAAAPRALTGAALDSPKALQFASRVAVVLSSDHISRPKYFDARAFSGVRARS